MKGKVVNPVTGLGIEGIEIQLQRGTLGLPGGNKSVKNTFTDADGNFEISKLGLSRYTLRAQTGVDYYNIGWFEGGENITGTGGMINVKRGKTMHVEYRAVEYGFSNLTINNVSCLGPSDTLILYQSSQWEPNANQTPWYHFGCAYWNDTSKIPMGTYYYHWIVKKSGITTDFFDTIFYNGNQTQSYSILY